MNVLPFGVTACCIVALVLGVTACTAVRRVGAALTAKESGGSLACLAWVWRVRYWLGCNDTSVRRIFEGGHWVQGSVQGRYRLIVADDEASGSSRAFVQWLEAKGRDAADSLAAAVELPEEVTRSEVPHFPFAERGGHWYLRVPTPKRA